MVESQDFFKQPSAVEGCPALPTTSDSARVSHCFVPHKNTINSTHPTKVHISYDDRTGWMVYRNIPNRSHPHWRDKSQPSILSHTTTMRQDGRFRSVSKRVPPSLSKSKSSIPSQSTTGQDGRFRNVPNWYRYY